MKKPKTINTPLTDNVVKGLKAGDRVLLTGTVFTARDAAHRRMVDTAGNGKFPFDLKGQVIFYAGPAPAKPGNVIGSIGPTTSYRMDAYTPELLKQGLKGMIGKGQRSSEVREAIRKYKAVYFAAIGGVSALLAKTVKKADIIAYGDLGTEAIRKLEVKKFPLIVINDVRGNDLYVAGVKKYGKY